MNFRFVALFIAIYLIKNLMLEPVLVKQIEIHQVCSL